MDIQGQAALITGGASGLGAATAEALIKAGAKVTLLDMGEAAGKALAGKLGCHFELCNVTDDAGTAAAIAAAEKVNGPARIVVNCAGVATPGRTVGKDGPLPLADFARVININLVGTFNVIRLAAARMQALAPLDTQERGVFVNVASIAGIEGQIGQAAYSASKAGVIGMTLPLAREFARTGIRVMTIAPGVFETPMLANQITPEIGAALAAAIPFPPRLGRPAEFAQLVVSIVSNPFLNGETIRLDGAQRLQPK